MTGWRAVDDDRFRYAVCPACWPQHPKLDRHARVHEIYPIPDTECFYCGRLGDGSPQPLCECNCERRVHELAGGACEGPCIEGVLLGTCGCQRFRRKGEAAA